MLGTRFGSWQLMTEVGRGPLGMVYKAIDFENPERTAAVKLLDHPMTRLGGFLEKFTAEMLGLQRLNHANIARLYDSGVQAGTAYYASEWVEGTDLAKLLKQPGRQTPGLEWNREFIPLAVQLARGLKHGHHRSILHRGLKPTNVIVMSDGTAKLTDFGVGRVIALAPLEQNPEPWGACGFLIPELLTGKAPTRRSDLYALGAVYYAALTGRPPFVANTPAEYLHKHGYTLPERPANLVPQIPNELDELICSLLAKDSSRRPVSSAAVLESLEQIRGKAERRGIVVNWPGTVDDGTGVEAALTESASSHPERPPVPRPLMARPAVVVPLFLLVMGIILYGLFRPGPDPDKLWSEAETLMASQDPDDWDRAWDDCLVPLERYHPDRYQAEVAMAKARIANRKELRRSFRTGSEARYASEAEKWYRVGLRLMQAGQAEAAQTVWTNLVTGFGPLEGEAEWVELAQDGLAELEQSPLPTAGRSARGLAELLQELESQTEPQSASRREALRALTELYRDDADALKRIEQAQ